VGGTNKWWEVECWKKLVPEQSLGEKLVERLEKTNANQNLTPNLNPN